MRRKRTKISIPFAETKVDAPLIMYSLNNGTVGYMVVDTGSEMTVFDKQFIKENKDAFWFDYTDYDYEICGINQKKHERVIISSSNVGFCNGDRVLISGVLSDINLPSDFPITCILGNDMLTKYNAKIDYKTRIVTLYL